MTGDKKSECEAFKSPNKLSSYAPFFSPLLQNCKDLLIVCSLARVGIGGFGLPKSNAWN